MFRIEATASVAPAVTTSLVKPNEPESVKKRTNFRTMITLQTHQSHTTVAYRHRRLSAATSHENDNEKLIRIASGLVHHRVKFYWKTFGTR
jgi:hypothetical protein